MRRLFLLLLCCVPGWFPLCAQHPLLLSGPMNGYSAMREVALWVQTRASAPVKFRYWPVHDPKHWCETAEVVTDRHTACTAILLADQAEAGQVYAYTLYIQGKPVKLPWPTEFRTQTLWQYRTDPPPVRFVAGSCAYVGDSAWDRPGKPYGGDYRIFQSITRQDPDFMVWLGDNTYLREVDFDSRTGIFRRYSHTRALPELQPLLGTCHHYAIWDDHDYGPNDSDRSYYLKGVSLEAFQRFWANPGYGLPDQPGAGATGFFSWADLDFFLLDNRWWRSPNALKTGPRSLHGMAQLNWLVEALRYSKASYKFVCTGGQMLAEVDAYETAYHLAREERDWLLRRIQEEGIEGVVFLTGDRHHTELDLWQPAGGVAVWDLTASPLTSTAYYAEKEENALRVPGTHTGVRNYCELQVTGKRDARVLRITTYDADGVQLWSRELDQKGLRN